MWSVYLKKKKKFSYFNQPSYRSLNSKALFLAFALWMLYGYREEPQFQTSLGQQPSCWAAKMGNGDRDHWLLGLSSASNWKPVLSCRQESLLSSPTLEPSLLLSPLRLCSPLLQEGPADSLANCRGFTENMLLMAFLDTVPLRQSYSAPHKVGHVSLPILAFIPLPWRHEEIFSVRENKASKYTSLKHWVSESLL